MNSYRCQPLGQVIVFHLMLPKSSFSPTALNPCARWPTSYPHIPLHYSYQWHLPRLRIAMAVHFLLICYFSRHIFCF